MEAPCKLLYSFIICDCSGAGIWVKDLEIATLYIGSKLTENQWKIFVDSGKAVDLNDGKFFFPDFIEHQYPKGFGENNPAHKNFILELQKYNLLDDSLKVLQRPLEGSKVMVMVMDEVEAKVKAPEEKKQYGKPEINKLIDYLKEKAEIAVLDGAQKENRNFCQHLINKIGKEKPNLSAVDGVKLLIDYGLKDKFHSKNITNFKYLYNHSNSIIKSIKQNNGQVKDAEYLENLERDLHKHFPSDN